MTPPVVGTCDRCHTPMTVIAAGQRAHPLCDDNWNAPSGPQAPPEAADTPTPADDRQRLLWAATALAERGWHVFPCQPGGKRPALRADWEHRATTDTARIARCWATGPYNIGVACGPSHLLVIDLDTPKPGQPTPPEWQHETGIHDGADVLATLCEHARQPWPSETFTVATPSGGTHLYFTAPPGTRLRNTAGRLGWLIDTRATGGYVIGPGSVIGGTPYTVVNPARPEPLPGWLAATLAADPAPPEPDGPVLADAMGDGQATEYALAALRGEVDRVLAATSNRNDTLNQAAFALGQLIAAGILPQHLAYRALTEAARRTGLDNDANCGPRGIDATIRSGFKAGARQPRRSAA
jgi:Bifunctional DNA primase/polymerase, N-terminal